MILEERLVPQILFTNTVNYHVKIAIFKSRNTGASRF